MEFEGRQLGQFSGPGKGKTEHRPTESLESPGAVAPRAACPDLPEPTKALPEFHFDLGDSSVGPIGFCASLHAVDTADAVELLRRTLPSEVTIEPCGSPEDNARITYIQAYLNPDAVGEQDIDARDGMGVEREVEEPKIHQREPDGRFVILDQKGTPFWWASFDNEAEARLAWSHFAQPPKPGDLSAQPKWHVERLQAFADLVARMTTDEEMGGDMSGDDAVMALGELIASARGLAAPPHAMEVKLQRTKLVEVVTAMLAEETDLRTRDNEYRSRRGWYGCTEDFSVTAAREALEQVKANPAPTPPEALAQRDRLLSGAKALLPDLGRLLFRYNGSRKSEGEPPLEEAPCFAEARAIVQRAENDTMPSAPENRRR